MILRKITDYRRAAKPSSEHCAVCEFEGEVWEFVDLLYVCEGVSECMLVFVCVRGNQQCVSTHID
jgi:hypothetical protein